MTRHESDSTQTIAVQYAVLGKLTAKPKIDGKRVKVRKKAHMLRDGRTLCRAENGYKNQPRYTPVENPEQSQICRNCLGLDGRSENSPQAAGRFEQYAEPLLSVLMGERVAEGLPDKLADNRASETTILGAG